MDSFLRRLKYYGFGFGLGLIFVFFFFKNRGCSWLPSNRVKNTMLERILVLSEDEEAYMKSKKISRQDIISALDDGDVDFGESIKKGNPKVYAVDKEIEGKGTMRFYFTLPSESFISEVFISPKKASDIKNTKEGYGKFLKFPNEKNLFFVDSNKVLTCKQDALGLVDVNEIQKRWKKSGRIDFNRSTLYKKPKAEHYILFNDKSGKPIGSRSIWYKNKVNISSFDIPYETGCE